MVIEETKVIVINLRCCTKNKNNIQLPNLQQ